MYYYIYYYQLLHLAMYYCKPHKPFPEAIKTLPKSPQNPPPTPSQNPPLKTPQNHPPKNTSPPCARKFPGGLPGGLPTVPLPTPCRTPTLAHGLEDIGVSC